MKASNLGAAIVAAVIIGSANGQPAAETRSATATTVLDVEFWGRRELTFPHPDDPTDDIIEYGDPVSGKFRIWTEDAPKPYLTADIQDRGDARIYGRNAAFHPKPASFVTTLWFTLPKDFKGGVEPFPGSVADDYVIVGDRVRFWRDAPRTDWFAVTDNYTRNFKADGESHNQLFVTVSTPRDIIDGIALEQEFDLVTPVESGDPGYGFFRQTLERGTRFFDFAIERLRVSKVRVCRR